MLKKMLSIALVLMVSGCSALSNNHVKKDPQAEGINEAELHFKKGISLVNNGIPGKHALMKAAREFAASIFLKPDFDKAHQNLGLTYFHLGELPLAVKRFKYITNNFSGPTKNKAIYNLGISYLKMNELDNALENFKLLDSDNYYDLKHKIGLIYALKKEYDLAEKEFKSALDVDSENHLVNISLGYLYMEKGANFFDKAIENILKGANGGKVHVDIYYDLGAMYYSKGDMKNAIQMFKKFSKFIPDTVETYFILGNAYYEQGEKDKAILSFLEAAKKNHINSMAALVKIYLEQGKTDIALEQINKVIGKDSENTNAYFNRGVIYQKMGNLNMALNSYERALEIDNENIMALNNLAVIYRKTANFNKSVKTYEALFEVAPDSYIAHRNMGVLYDVYLDMPKKAEHHYKKYLQGTPDKKEIIEGWLKEVEQRQSNKL